MTRISLLNSPLLLGFDQFERRLESIAKTSAEGYPPYNIEQIGSDQLRISIAVAGFPLRDLEIDLVDSQLIIKGHKQEEDERLREGGIDYRTISYPGGHDIDEQTLLTLATSGST